MKAIHLFTLFGLFVFFTACQKQEPLVAEDPIEESFDDLDFRAASNAIKFKVGSSTGAPGDRVCVDVTVKNFKDIVGVQYSMRWRKKVLEFDGVENFNLNGLDASSFGTPDPGRLNLVWFDPDLDGETVGNNKPIYTVCFRIKNNPAAEMSRVAIKGNPLPIEVTDKDLNVLEVKTRRGTIEVMD